MENHFKQIVKSTIPSEELDEGSLVRGAEAVEDFYYDKIVPHLKKMGSKLKKIKGQINVETVKHLGSSLFRDTKTVEKQPDWTGYKWYRISDHIQVWLPSSEIVIFNGVTVLIGDSGTDKGKYIIAHGRNPILCETKFHLAEELRNRYKIYITPHFEAEKRGKEKVKSFFKNFNFA